jgi:hypothetical protein
MRSTAALKYDINAACSGNAAAPPLNDPPRKPQNGNGDQRYKHESLAKS